MLLVGVVFVTNFHLRVTKMAASAKLINLQIWNNFLLIRKKKTVSWLSLSPKSYKEATDLLKQRYEKTQVLINVFMKKNLSNFQLLKSWKCQVLETFIRSVGNKCTKSENFGSTFINQKTSWWFALRGKCPYSESFWSVFSRIQSKCGKIQTRKTPNTDTFTQCWFKDRLNIWHWLVGFREILNFVKNELEVKERTSFVLSHTSDQ